MRHNSTLNTQECFATGGGRNEENGYALLALMVAMAILAIMLTAAAPVLKFEAQRERELEAIRRGEQVAQAIREYVLARGTLPTSMRDLEEGITRSGRTKKRYVLRRSSMRDPLSEDGEWQLVGPTDRGMQRFVASVIEHAGGQIPPPTSLPPQLQPVFNQVVSLAQASGALRLSPSEGTGSDDEIDEGVVPDIGSTTSKPFIGVASKSTGDSIISYYGIGKHNRIVFTPLFR
ncbi:MAG: type II secretion system GspH family protein [Pyrinomonadaceae bacterium MAG19_C2-C3]|nr:type II secretion system GspH family protein [Pyrinomonadaceae bacterium MAG19_C2-C3]